MPPQGKTLSPGMRAGRYTSTNLYTGNGLAKVGKMLRAASLQPPAGNIKARKIKEPPETVAADLKRGCGTKQGPC